MKKIAVIGAGLSGLSVASLLKNRAEVVVFEKARGVSGRMSTRYAGPYCFDHGAQYFTVRTEAFKTFIQPLINNGIIGRWNANYVKFDGQRITERKNWLNDEPRYVGIPGMNSIAKHLSEDLNIHINTRITSLKQANSWQLIDEEDKVYDGFDWVIFTVPAPQTLALIPETFQYYTDISAVKMRACFALMLGFANPLTFKFEAAHISNADLSWLAVNSHKPGRANQFTLVVHSSEDYAETHFDDDREIMIKHLCAQTSDISGYDVSRADYKTIHRWRYANNAVRKNHPVLIDQNLNLAVCGDWCLGGRIENAFTSAYNLTNVMKESLL
ncbi:MAG: NAD(P)-binding protein [Endozoicomonadaceae bacterium]|nr:NAD(P)-binding protein [Endozoicomonadaceae bacterium]